MNKISAIILVGGKMDENLYKKCLNSVSWCDQIVKVETEKIKGGFVQWRNEGAKKATGEWLLYVDSDEEVTENLRLEILNLIGNWKLENSVGFASGNSAYAIPRDNIFLGKHMRWGGWSPDFVLRLIKKDKLIAWSGELHEQPQIKGDTGHLKNPMIHTSHRSITEMIDKTNKWSEIEAKLLFESNHPPMNIARFFSAGFREFWYRGVVKLGFLDGTTGVIEIIYQIFSRLITYTKLWELQLEKKDKQNLAKHYLLKKGVL